MLAVVAIEQHRHDRAVRLAGGLRQEFGAAVATAVVDQDDLHLAIQQAAGGAGAAQEFRQAGFFVVDGITTDSLSMA